MWYFLGHTNGIFKKSDKKIENMQNNPCHWACFQKVKKQTRKKQVFFGGAYLTAKSINYARHQGNCLLIFTGVKLMFYTVI